MAIREREKLLLSEAVALGISVAGVMLSMGYPFFRFITYAGSKDDRLAKLDKKSNSTKSNRKKWFQLKHTKVNHPRYKHEEEYLATREWCEQQNMEDMYVRSFDGLILHANYLPAEKPERIILFSHGYRGYCFGSIAHMAKYLHENHCSLLFIDQRCCGESEGEYITFGAKEQYDILSWVQFIHNKLQPSKHNVRELKSISSAPEQVSELSGSKAYIEDKLPVYLLGQSMGASSVIMASAHELPAEVKGIIADCGFHSMKQQLSYMAKEWFHFHWIGLLLLRVDFFCRLFAGFKMKEADTTAALKENKRPILFFHGEDDTYVSPDSTELNFELCQAHAEKVIVPGARHLCSSYEAPELYKKKLMEFFKEND